MKIESMCVVCHGPVPSYGYRPTSVCCGVNCRGIFKRDRELVNLPERYTNLRMTHAYRRELEAVYHKVSGLASLLDRAGELGASPAPVRTMRPRREVVRLSGTLRH